MRRRYRSIVMGFVTAILTVAATSLVSAQQISSEEVPAAVKSSFAKSSRGLSADWMKSPGNFYEAAFSVSGKNTVYVYNAAGVLTQKKMESSKALLPTSIGQDLAYEHPAKDILKIYRVMTRSKKKYYEVHVDDQSKVLRLQFDLAGEQFASVSVPKDQNSTPVMIASNVAPAASTGGNQMAMRGESSMGSKESLYEDDLIDDDIADLFEDDPLYNDNLDYDLDMELDQGELADDDWENLILEEDDDLEIGWDDPELN